MTTLKAAEGFTLEQILDEGGFTLDTTDFLDLAENEEDNFSKKVNMNTEEMLKMLQIDDENNETKTETKTIDDTPFIGVGFDTLRPKMTSIFQNGEILKLVKVEGVGAVVPSCAEVTVEYVGYFEYQDEPFDSTYFHNDKKAIIRLGVGKVIQGIDISISTMKKYETSLFLIKPSLAFGPLGCLPRILPNAEVLFKIKVLDFVDSGPFETYDDLSAENKKKFSVIEKLVRGIMNTAQDNVKKQKTNQAIREYNKIVNYLDNAHLENDEEEKSMNELLSRVLTNLTVLYNKINKPKLACASFQRLPNKSGKAYFQNGKALAQLGEYESAMDSLQKANTLAPENEDVIKEINKLEDCRQKYKEYCKRFAQNSLQIVNKKKIDEFEEIVIEMCESFIKNMKTNKLLKQQLPFGLTEQEMESVRRVVAQYNLSITKQKRYNVETLYITSKTYY